jgi:asparagine synthase (glutamine-hydrolysing)
MCGINGIIQKQGADPAALTRDLATMNRAIRHRGPDGEGSYIEGKVALGHRRLAILDLSEDGAQPMFNEDRSLVLVFNGEIYNYLELREELSMLGYRFHSRTDSEVILHGYAAWGDDCVHRFNGMWAFAIWDSRRRRLLLSRDRLGVKPLYFRTEEDGGLIFSSEIKAIAAVRSIKEANLGKVHDYLAYGYRTNDGETFFQGVNELPGGHHLVMEGDRVRTFRYWQLPEPSTERSEASEAQLCREFTDLLEDAVRVRFRSDVPVALLQSGGLDSSAIARIVADGIARGDLDKESVTAFTAHFPGYALDETDIVRDFLKTCPGISLKVLEVGGVDLAASLADFAYQMDEPVYSTTSFAHWSLMREVRSQGIKVVINGQGSDEAFAGYGRYAIGYRLLDSLLTSPVEFLRQLRGARRTMGFGMGMLMSQLAKACLGRKSASRCRARFAEGSFGALDPQFHIEHNDHLGDLSATFIPRNLDRHLRGQLEHYGFNQILHYEDHSSMAHSVEIRSPFIDYRLMEFAFRIPDSFKLEQGVTKRILRNSFKERLPDTIVGNHRKIGFNTPFEEWMKSTEMQILLNDLFHSSEFTGRSIWKAKHIQSRLEKGDWTKFPLWRFINLELWARTYGIVNL